MFRKLITVTVLLSAAELYAQYSTSAPYSPLTIAHSADKDITSCNVTWYDPTIYLLPDAQQLTLLAQGNNDRNGCQSTAIDALFPATRSSTGTWTTPVATECPRVQGAFRRCQWNSTDPAISGPIGSPSVVRVVNSNSTNDGQRYFMAFLGGNGDFIEGRIYWARSDDGVNWTVLGGSTSEGWTPLLQAKHIRSSSNPRSAPPCTPPSAITQVQLAHELGWMYVFAQYFHPIQPECEYDQNAPACLNSPWHGYSGAMSQLLFRFQYNSAQPWGFTSLPQWQVFQNGAWTSHTGKLVFPYDVNSSGQPLGTEFNNATQQFDTVLGIYNSAETAGMEFGAGDVRYGNRKWLRLYSHPGYPGQTRVQTTTCLNPAAGCTWSSGQNLDLTNIRNNGYSNLTGDIQSGIYFGTLPTATGRTAEHWWIWVPAPTANTICIDPATQQRSVHSGLSLIPAQLCTPDVPCGTP